MANDYYGSESEPSEKSPEGSDEETFLAPKNLFPDCKPGETKKVKVVAVYDDEIELAYVKDDKKEEKEETSDDRMQRMAV